MGMVLSVCFQIKAAIDRLNIFDLTGKAKPNEIRNSQ